MSSRRSLLTAGGGVAAMAVAGCTTLFSGGGTHTLDDDATTLPTETAVAASEHRELTIGPGYVNADAVLYEIGDAFVVHVRCRVETNEDDWAHTRFRTEHDWRGDGPLDVQAYTSNAIPSDDDPLFELETAETGEWIEWDANLIGGQRRPLTYEFASRADRGGPDLGERLVDTQLEVWYDESGIFGSERGGGTTLRIEYGDGAADGWQPPH